MLSHPVFRGRKPCRPGIQLVKTFDILIPFMKNQQETVWNFLNSWYLLCSKYCYTYNFVHWNHFLYQYFVVWYYSLLRDSGTSGWYAVNPQVLLTLKIASAMAITQVNLPKINIHFLLCVFMIFTFPTFNLYNQGNHHNIMNEAPFDNYIVRAGFIFW